jgi:hypothetical protein
MLLSIGLVRVLIEDFILFAKPEEADFFRRRESEEFEVDLRVGFWLFIILTNYSHLLQIQKLLIRRIEGKEEGGRIGCVQAVDGERGLWWRGGEGKG